jgi:hypothetical protein
MGMYRLKKLVRKTLAYHHSLYVKRKCVVEMSRHKVVEQDMLDDCAKTSRAVKCFLVKARRETKSLHQHQQKSPALKSWLEREVNYYIQHEGSRLSVADFFQDHLNV